MFLEVSFDERSFPGLNGQFDALGGDFGFVVGRVGNDAVNRRVAAAFAIGFQLLLKIGREKHDCVADAEANIVLCLSLHVFER